jgi:hypothetical protein
MPSPTGVKVTLDKVRTLRYTNRSIVMLEDESGLTAQEVMARVGAGSLKAINQLIWAGLLHADPGLTFVDVLDMVDVERLPEIGAAAGEAIGAAFGTNGEAPEGKAGAQAKKG